jgi:amidohydrolase family protein
MHLWLILAASVAPLAAQSLVVRNATVFDPVRGVMVGGQTLRVVDGRFVSGVRAARGGRVIDARGLYIIPGLIDAHVHLVHRTDYAHMTPEEVLPAYLAYGVTSVRSTGDEIVAEKLAQRLSDANPSRNPRIFLASPLIDGDPPHHADIGRPLTDSAKVPEFLADLKAWGVTTLKIYVRTERPIGKLVIEEGHRQGFVVAAHLGKYTAQDAVADGIDVLEHIWSVFNYSFPPEADARPALERRAGLDLENPTAVALRRLIKERGAVVDPTLAVFRNMLLLNDLPEIREHPDNATAPRRLRGHWTDYIRQANLQPATRELRRREFGKYQELTGKLYREGIPLLAGTDSPEPLVPPGAALHQELEMLVESGLSPAAALAAATVNNARAVRQESQLGTLEPGKLADFVILSANPLDDIRNTRKIVSVVRGGFVAEPAALLKLVPKD